MWTKNGLTMDWEKDLPSQVKVTDEYGNEHTCQKRLVGLGWYGPSYRIEYYEPNFITDEKKVFLSADGHSIQETTEKMAELLAMNDLYAI